MRIKTNELSGVQLDWAVANCEGLVSIDTKNLFEPWYLLRDYKPSTNWAQGGEIIEREGIQIQKHLSGWIALPIGAAFSEEEYQEGETPLVAAMRCYVGSKLGNEIEIPIELEPCES